MSSNKEKKNSQEVEPLVGNTDQSCTPRQIYTQNESAPTVFVLIEKVKALYNEVVMSLEMPQNTYDVDDFILMTDDFLRDMKRIKVQRRFDSRRFPASKNVTQRSPLNVDALSLVKDAGGEEKCDDSFMYSQLGGQGPKTYMAALLTKQKKVSPLRGQQPSTNRADVEAERHASALRSEERHRLAEERRLDHIQDIKMKSVEAEARVQRAKARREEAELRQRTETQERQENGVRRAEEARKQTKDRVRQAHSHVDEVVLTNDLRQQTKALLIDKKMSDIEHNQEQLREGRQRVLQERNEAVLAAAERRRNLSQERAEKQQQREQQRQETLKRIEEQKKSELEVKQQKAEEWEKKVHQHHVDALSEAEALSKKTEEKLAQSAQLREEQREKMRQKLEKQEEKLKEARQRRDKDPEVKPVPQALLPNLSGLEEEQLSLRVSKLVASNARQGRAFIDNYQKESLFSTRDLNRSKLRPSFSRISSSLTVPAITQCKQPLNDIMTCDLVECDYEFMRYFNMFEVLVKLITEARKLKEYSVLKDATELLQMLFVEPNEGGSNIIYVVRSGNMLPLVLAAREEAKALRQMSHTGALCSLLTLIGIGLERTQSEAQSGVKLIATRDQLFNDADTIALDKVCLTVLKNCRREEDLELTYSALCILNSQLSHYAKKKNDLKTQWFQSLAEALFTLLQNTFTPEGASAQEERSQFSCARVTILFCTFRLLNALARWQLNAFQELLHEKTAPTTSPNPSGAGNGGTGSAAPVQINRTEVFHVLSSFFAYVQQYSEDLESIAPTKDTVDESSVSFSEAHKFGITLTDFPVFPYPKNIDAQKPGGKMYHLRAALHECILLLGYLCLDDAPLQEMMSWGKEKTLLSILIGALPIQYFSTARHILFPTLIAIISNSGRNLQIAQTEMDLCRLLNFINEEYDLLSRKAKLYAQEHYKMLVEYRAETDPQQAFFERMRGKSWAEDGR
ncbi:hypothetical protein STCU_09443 [Strigomonas culicis]|uniref:Uncharacterized protein n=1 Tax=Strigomonas culicis TaxID=28005 RepID=S9V933_9TRYP|nr:hypothetical protein STCU_09443 [Strigomonas culicis]|eukprot:EPY19470.1 hypothetical protein STCU_09443 [Strigomonas culicis]